MWPRFSKPGLSRGGNFWDTDGNVKCSKNSKIRPLQKRVLQACNQRFYLRFCQYYEEKYMKNRFYWAHPIAEAGFWCQYWPFLSGKNKQSCTQILIVQWLNIMLHVSSFSAWPFFDVKNRNVAKIIKIVSVFISKGMSTQRLRSFHLSARC